MGFKHKLFNYILLLISCFFWAKGNGQQLSEQTDSFYLKGKISGIDTGTIVLFFPNNRNQMVRDTATIVDGSFLLKGKISQPMQCGLKTLYQDNFASVFIEPKRQTIVLQKGDFFYFKMNGSYTQKQADTLQASLEKWRLKNEFLGHLHDSLNKIYSTQEDTIKQQHDSQALDSILSLMYANSNKQTEIQTTFIAKHPNSYVSAAILHSLFIVYHLINSKDAQALYNHFSSTIQNSYDGKLIYNELLKQKSNRIGSFIPEINTNDVNGKPFSFSNLKGKYVLVDFWASWCLPCRKAIPHLKKSYQQYYPLGFDLVLISIDAEDADWRKAIQDASVDSFINILATAKMNTDFVNTQMPIPNQILLDRDGKIIWNSIYEENNETIDDVLDKEFK